jgi:predicted PurR-regulated permease PerM
VINLLLDRLLLTSDTSTGDMQIVGGWVGDGLDNIVESIKEGIVEIGNWLIKGFFNITSPIADYGIKCVIVVCFVIYYCSQDNRAISKGIKYLFFYLLYILLRSVII